MLLGLPKGNGHYFLPCPRPTLHSNVAHLLMPPPPATATGVCPPLPSWVAPPPGSPNTSCLPTIEEVAYEGAVAEEAVAEASTDEDDDKGHDALCPTTFQVTLKWYQA